MGNPLSSIWGKTLPSGEEVKAMSSSQRENVLRELIEDEAELLELLRLVRASIRNVADAGREAGTALPERGSQRRTKLPEPPPPSECLSDE